jgi:nitrogen regulatory protein PII
MKLIVALVEDARTDEVVDAAREAGATGATVITSVRGEGLNPGKTFLGMDLSGARDVLLFIVVDTRCREILETIARAGRFDEEHGAGVAIQLDVEDAIGMTTQLPTLIKEVEEEV